MDIVGAVSQNSQRRHKVSQSRRRNWLGEGYLIHYLGWIVGAQSQNSQRRHKEPQSRKLL
jgi:hypothetical protein